MKRKILITIGLSLILGLIITSCASSTGPSPASIPTSDTISKPVVKEQVEWEKLLSAAKAEGRVTIVTSMGPEVKRELTKGFHDRFGIEVEFLIGRGQETIIKIQNERRAGLYVSDIIIGGATSLTSILAPSGWLEPVEPALILPEIIDPKVWWAGKLPLAGYGYGMAVMKYVNIPLLINTDQVKIEEIKSYRDLLDPKWKGKIVMDDPTVTGSGGKLATYILREGIAGGEEFLRGLVKQEPVINRDRRLVAEWLARGKYAIAIAARPEMAKPLMDMGMPIKWVTPSEGTYVTAGGGIASLLNRPLHPNAAKLLLNWVLTKEAAIMWQRATGTQSARVDVPIDMLSQDHIRKPGVKYFDSDIEQFEKDSPALFEVVRPIFAPVMK